MYRTISLQLKGNYPELVGAIEQYNHVVNEHIKTCIKLKTTSKLDLHKLLYFRMRKKFPDLPSSLIQSARDNAVEMLKGNKMCVRTYKRRYSNIRFNKGVAKVFLESGKISLSTIQGRNKYSISVPDYFMRYSSWDIQAVNLGLKDKDWIKINVVVKKKGPVQINNKECLGIDLGFRNFATLSDGERIKGKEVKKIKRNHAYLRKRLQSKGTRSAKRHLKKLSGRERRFMIDYNHCLSKNLSQMDYGGFILEDLRGIRKRKKGKALNRMIGNWAYYQLKEFLTYKSEALGKSVIVIHSKYTSQRCSNCRVVDKKHRNKGAFKCERCGFVSSADFNASRNIFQIGHCAFLDRLSVNQPIVTMGDQLRARQNNPVTPVTSSSKIYGG